MGDAPIPKRLKGGHKPAPTSKPKQGTNSHRDSVPGTVPHPVQPTGTSGGPINKGNKPK